MDNSLLASTEYHNLTTKLKQLCTTARIGGVLSQDQINDFFHEFEQYSIHEKISTLILANEYWYGHDFIPLLLKFLIIPVGRTQIIEVLMAQDLAAEDTWEITPTQNENVVAIKNIDIDDCYNHIIETIGNENFTFEQKWHPAFDPTIQHLIKRYIAEYTIQHIVGHFLSPTKPLYEQLAALKDKRVEVIQKLIDLLLINEITVDSKTTCVEDSINKNIWECFNNQRAIKTLNHRPTYSGTQIYFQLSNKP